LNITIVNTYLKGGASKSAQRLHLGLVNLGYDPKFLVKNNKGCEQALISGYLTVEKPNKIERVKKYLKIADKSNPVFDGLINNRSLNGLDKFSLPYSKLNISRLIEVQNADVINLHWVADFLDYRSFFKSNDKPVFWTLHYESPYSYGEHYNEKYILDKQKNIKPRFKSQFEKKCENKIRDFKLKIFDKVENLEIIGPSKWICDESKKSELFSKYKTNYIPNGINTGIYRLWDKSFAKKFFNINEEYPSLLFVADNVNDNRKGLRLLLSALEFLKEENLNLLIVGSGEININTKNTKHTVYRFGRINDERVISLVYNAADYFLIPSIMDNLPNTAIESICCGTPVIGFRIGGIPDIVSHGENGYLADNLDSERLAENILKGIRNIDSFDNEYISSEAIKKYPLELQASRYIELFKNTI
jgi:glycosyltransferase involved in cell wall biosynthesis